MRSTTFLVLALAFVAIAPVSTVSALEYGETVFDVREGEHPYEARKRVLNLKKEAKEDYDALRNKGYSYFDPVYYHPLFAQRSVLHPFYRKGGSTVYLDGRYSSWRGYSDPVVRTYYSPEQHCTNYFEEYSPRGDIVGIQCF